MFVFAVMSPIGAGIGIIITSQASVDSTYFMTLSILQALSGGTILYVVTFQVLERERSKNVSGFAQWFFVLLGFIVFMAMEIMKKLRNHEHGNDHDNDTNSTMFSVSLGDIPGKTNYLIELE